MSYFLQAPIPNYRIKCALCFPLLNLTWKDVWAYIISNNLPYPSIYDRYAEVLGYDKVRLVTFFDNEFEKLGAPYLDGVLMPEFRNIKE